MRLCRAALIFLLIGSGLLAAQIRVGVVRVSEGYMQERLVKRVDPVYPPLARQARLQGTVILQVKVSKTGDVESVQIFSGHPMLAPAAIEAVKQWKYRPYLMQDQPVAMETKVSVNFTLTANPPAQGTVGSVPGGIPAGEPGGIVDSMDARDPHSPPPDRVRISQRIEEALVLKKVPPEYPAEARHDRIQGAVVLRVIVDKRGSVANVELISGHPSLAPAAIEAVRNWKYKPYLLNQQPVEVETQVTVNFTLAQ